MADCALQEREKAAAEQDEREKDIALGNPLLLPNKNTDTKRRWDDDVVFRNQARGTERKGKPEFVNVSDHAMMALSLYR